MARKKVEGVPDQIESGAAEAERLMELRKQEVGGEDGDAMEIPPEDDGIAPDDPETPNDTLQDSDFDFSKLEDDVPQNPPPRPSDDIAHKYDVLQGKYKAETDRLSAMLSQAMQRIGELESRSNNPTESSTPPDSDTDLEDFKTNYPALFKGVYKLVQQEAGSMVKSANDKVERIQQESEQSKRQVYFDQLGKLVPGWEKLNSHPSFLKWLEAPDTFSGASKKHLLLTAFNRMDYNTTAKFFDAFIKEKGIRVREPQSSDTDDIAPDTSGVSVRNESRNTATITGAQIEKFYADRVQGRYQGTEQDAIKFEARIMQAVKEGKIR